MNKSRGGHGGSREGSGRKPDPDRLYLVRQSNLLRLGLSGNFVLWAREEIQRGDEGNLASLVDYFIYKKHREEAVALLREITEILDSDSRIERLPKVVVAAVPEDQDDAVIVPFPPEGKRRQVVEKMNLIKRMMIPKRIDEAVNKAMAGVGNVDSEMSGQQRKIRDSKLAVARHLPDEERSFWEWVRDTNLAAEERDLTEEDLIPPDPEVYERVRQYYSEEAILERRGTPKNEDEE